MMLEELQRRNYSQTTVNGYLKIVEAFAKHFLRSPDQLGPEQIRAYQVYLFTGRKLNARTVNELNRRRWTKKVWCSKRGTEHPGNPFKKASLRRLLTNAIYVGQVEHRARQGDTKQ
jgi:Phage integrase, N-terminal SAM-like domain